MSEDVKLLKIIAALESCTAHPVTLFLAGLFGEKKTRIDAEGTITVSRWRGKFYMLDYTPLPSEQKELK